MDKGNSDLSLLPPSPRHALISSFFFNIFSGILPSQKNFSIDISALAPDLPSLSSECTTFPASQEAFLPTGLSAAVTFQLGDWTTGTQQSVSALAYLGDRPWGPASRDTGGEPQGTTLWLRTV